jgi:hypothetical protein
MKKYFLLSQCRKISASFIPSKREKIFSFRHAGSKNEAAVVETFELGFERKL